MIFEYADRLGKGAVFKRLGFLLSRMDVDDRMSLAPDYRKRQVRPNLAMSQACKEMASLDTQDLGGHTSA